MTIRQRLRPLITALLLCIHIHSLIFFVSLLCVSSDDLATDSAQSLTNSTLITDKINSIAEESTDELVETTITSIKENSDHWHDFDIKHANSKLILAKN